MYLVGVRCRATVDRAPPTADETMASATLQSYDGRSNNHVATIPNPHLHFSNKVTMPFVIVILDEIHGGSASSPTTHRELTTR